MSVAKLTAHTKDVGGIPVARILPNTKGRRTIGAWCFLDHAGPAEFDEDSLGLQVGLHPHTNLQTFTWMLAGEILHKDSLGNEQAIRPKQVNLMTAGTSSATGEKYGISHTEQTLNHSPTLHAVQLWIALPMDKTIEPSFYHYPDLPTWKKDEVTYTLTTGEFDGYHAPTLQYSPLVGIDIVVGHSSDNVSLENIPSKKISFPIKPNFEYGILVLKGQINFQGQTYLPDELILLTDCQIDIGQELLIEASYGSHFMLLGGEPLPHKTLIWWNFVDNDIEGLKQSVRDWNNKHSRFGDISLESTPLKRLVSPDVPSNLRIPTNH